jgi:hypothetical protein
MYTNLVRLLDILQGDNGRIFLDNIEERLADINEEEDIEIIAIGDEASRSAVFDKYGFSKLERDALNNMLEIAFDGVSRY